MVKGFSLKSMKVFKFYDLDITMKLFVDIPIIFVVTVTRGVCKYKYLARYGKAPIFYVLINNQILVGTNNSIFPNNSLIDIQY